MSPLLDRSMTRREALKAIAALGLVSATSLLLPRRRVWALDRTMIPPQPELTINKWFVFRTEFSAGPDYSFSTGPYTLPTVDMPAPTTLAYPVGVRDDVTDWYEQLRKMRIDLVAREIVRQAVAHEAQLIDAWVDHAERLALDGDGFA
jgi:hypothetical protein